MDGFFTLVFGLSSINTLTVISVTRYIKGCHPNQGETNCNLTHQQGQTQCHLPVPLLAQEGGDCVLTEVTCVFQRDTSAAPPSPSLYCSFGSTPPSGPEYHCLAGEATKVRSSLKG